MRNNKKSKAIQSLICALVFVTLLAPSMSAAQTLEAEPPPPAPTTSERAIAAGVAVIPGFAIHGAGHFVLGERDTAYKLLIMEGAGLGLLGIGVLGLAVTGAASEFVAPLSWSAMAGASLFFGSFAGDLYGVLASPKGTGSALVMERTWEVSLGYQFHYNTSFEHNHFGFVGAEGRYSGLRITPRFWYAMDDENWRVDTDVAWRFYGPRPGKRAQDGTYLEVELGYAHHAYNPQGFRENVYDAQLKTRIDVIRLAETLKGAFMDYWLGMAVAEYRRDYGGADTATVLLGGFALGSYLGHDEKGWGEWSLFYDHRHDDFAGGFLFPGVGSGVVGSFGGRLEKHIWKGFGLRASAEVGSAFVGNLHLVYRDGSLR